MSDDIEWKLQQVRERLIAARRNAGLTQTEAAHLVGLGCASSLSQHETGLRGINVNLRLLLKLCVAYGVQPEWVLSGETPDISDLRQRAQNSQSYLELAMKELQS